LPTAGYAKERTAFRAANGKRAAHQPRNRALRDAPAMGRILGICVAVLLLIVLVYPFAQEAYHRYLVSERLKTVMTAQERVEFHNWNGDALSFAKRLYERCELTQGKGAIQCDRYRYAYEQ
jgi:hypothetical protein